MRRTDPREFVHDLVLRRHRPVESSIQVVREKRDGNNAVFAIAFDDLSGEPQRALLGLNRDSNALWHSAGGSSGPPRLAQDADLWTMCGGWGPPGPAGKAAVVAGWVAAPDAVVARLTDPAGHSLEDRIEREVAIFFWTSQFDPRQARLELIDANGRVSRAGPMFPSD
jgi:hypothetical protein